MVHFLCIQYRTLDCSSWIIFYYSFMVTFALHIQADASRRKTTNYFSVNLQIFSVTGKTSFYQVQNNGSRKKQYRSSNKEQQGEKKVNRLFSSDLFSVEFWLILWRISLDFKLSIFKTSQVLSYDPTYLSLLFTWLHSLVFKCLSCGLISQMDTIFIQE